jgi:hypothetical protein
MEYKITRPHKQIRDQLENELKGDLWFVFEPQISNELWLQNMNIFRINEIYHINIWIKSEIGYSLDYQIKYEFSRIRLG